MVDPVSKFEAHARGAARLPFTEIPIVDGAPLRGGSAGDLAGMARALDAACRNVGFFYLRNHGIPQPVIDRAFAEAHRFFALPREEKMKIHYKKSRTWVRGFTPIGELKADPSAKGDLQEAFDFGVELPPEDPDHRAGVRMHGPNQWPAALPSFRIGTYRYLEAAVDLGRRLFRAFALALDLPPDFFDPMITKPLAQGRAIFYPPSSPDALEDRERWGVGTHSDYECFTILAQDDVGGLQVRNSAGRWIEATPVPGTLLINIGDMMARWTNRIYQSTPHRVLNRADRPRYSLVLFYGANHDAVIECLPTCRDEKHPPKFPPVTQGAWTEQQIAGIYPWEV
jgi:isopenicillin N synthase-like dioxygenase